MTWAPRKVSVEWLYSQFPPGTDTAKALDRMPREVARPSTRPALSGIVARTPSIRLP